MNWRAIQRDQKKLFGGKNGFIFDHTGRVRYWSAARSRLVQDGYRIAFDYMSVTYPKLTKFYRSMKELGILSYEDVTKALAASDKFVDNIELAGNMEKFLRRSYWQMTVIDKVNKRRWVWSSWQWSMATTLKWFRDTVHAHNKRRRRWVSQGIFNT